MLELKELFKSYRPGTVNETCLFKGFSLTVKEGEFVSVIGSNGSGKTSMLNLICGSLKSDKGSIWIGDKNITNQPEYMRYKRIGRVYQNPSMGSCSNMTILENMAMSDNKGKGYGLGLSVDKKQITRYQEMLRTLNLGLEDKLHIQAGTLSGGQRQALALLMATMTPIEFLILDEHTAALDPSAAETVMELTNKIVQETGVTTIMVTHNLRYAVQYGSRILMMHQGHAIIDRSGEEKQNTTTENLLELFQEISLELGN